MRSADAPKIGLLCVRYIFTLGAHRTRVALEQNTGLREPPKGGPDNDFDILGASKQLTNAENFNAYPEIDSSVRPA